MSIHTVLGAGGAIADALSRELLALQLPVRLVSRHPVQRPGTTVLAADLTDPGHHLSGPTPHQRALRAHP